MIRDIDFKPDEPVYSQITDYIRTQVALGKFKPDERLPAIRVFADKLGIDPGTVARAYRELEQEGTIISRRGSGSFISARGSEKHLTEQRRQRLSLVIEKSILESLGLGFSPEDIETAFTLSLAAWQARRKPSAKTKPATSQKRIKTIRFQGSHDLSVELLAHHFDMLYPNLHFNTTFVGSMEGLIALERGEADIAGAHLLDEETGEFNIPIIQRLMPNETVVLMNLVQRIQGLMVAPGNPKRILGIKDITRKELTFMNRQKGSGTRILLDTQLRSLKIKSSKIKGYEHEETTHMAVAAIIARGEADVGLGVQSAASVAGLDFIPLFKERYDLVALKETFDSSPLSHVLEIVESENFRAMLNSITGCDTGETGKIKIVKPK
jgi:molybdate-binding protein/DNA-binding transcriptional regulator YhcF (GntR family)